MVMLEYRFTLDLSMIIEQHVVDYDSNVPFEYYFG